MSATLLPRRVAIAGAIVLAALALWLRANGLAIWPMWLDEAYSAFGAEQGLGFIWTVLPQYETHPPLYSTLLSFWSQVAGTSLLAFRAFGLAIGLASLPIFWVAGRELGRNIGQDPRWLGLMALAIAVVSPSLVDMARLIRPYYLIILVNALGCWAVLRIARSLDETQDMPRFAWWSYVACLALLVWLHSLGALYAAALGLALIVAAGPTALLRHWKRWIAGHAVAAIAVIPALLIVADQAPTWTQSTWLAFVPQALPRQLLLIHGLPGVEVALIALGLIAAGIFATPPGRGRSGGALLLMAAFPVVAAIALSLTVAPVFLVRTLVATSVPALLLVAAGAGQKLLARAVFAILLVTFAVRAVQVQQLPPEQDWYAVIRWLAPRMQPHDVVYAYPNEGALPLRYALRDLGKTAAIRDLPGPIPARDPAGYFPAGNRAAQSLPDWRLAQIADDAGSAKVPTIWLLRINTRYYDPRDRALRVFAARRDVIADYDKDAIEITGLRQRATPPRQSLPKTGN
jgi:mannosyltransferase